MKICDIKRKSISSPEIAISTSRNSADLKILGSEDVDCQRKESKMIFTPLKWMKVLKSKSKNQHSNKESKRKFTIWPKWLKVTKKFGHSKAKKCENPIISDDKNKVILEERGEEHVPAFKPATPTVIVQVKKYSLISESLDIVQQSQFSKVNLVTKLDKLILSPHFVGINQQSNSEKFD